MVEVLDFFDLLQEHKLNFAIKEEAKREWCSAYDWEYIWLKLNII